MATILVTGANGFIGSRLVRDLIQRGHSVRGLVRPTSDLASLAGVPVELHLGDVTAPETLAAPMKDVEYVYHLAGALFVTDRDTFQRTNVDGTRNVLDAAERHAGPRLRRILITSSQAAVGPNPSPAPIDETYEPKPVSWYGESKRDVEALARLRADRLPITIVRPSSVYGEREQDISRTFPVVASRLQPRLGNASNRAVMVYVGDLVQGMIAAAESDQTRGRTYFLNHPRALSPADTVKTISQALGKPAGLPLPTPPVMLRLAAPFAEFSHHFTRQRPAMTRDKARELSQPFWVADPSAAKRDFGWEAQCDLLDGMRRTTLFWTSEQRALREMPLEPRGLRWMKFVSVASALGVLIEISAATGKWYSFEPGWFVFIIIFIAFGFALGSLAMLLRTQSGLIQFVVGSVLAGAAELANVLLPSSAIRWIFAPGWPFGITDPVVRALVLGLAGGFFILIVNAIMRSLYKQRLRFG